MAYYPKLMTLFKAIYGDFNLKSQQDFASNFDKYKNEIQDKFEFDFKENTDFASIKDEIITYARQNGLTMSIMPLWTYSKMAQTTVDIFEHYVKNRVMPSRYLGTAIFETYLNGVNYIPSIEMIHQELQPHDRVSIVHEINNPFDKNALRIDTKDGQKIGYIPKTKNEQLQYILEQGHKIFGVIKRAYWSEDGVSIKIIVYIEG